MRRIVISIRPQWVVKILNGEKTIEIRKTAPKCELPCEVYIYCTNGREVLKPNKINPQYRKIKAYSIKKGCVCAKFTLNKVEKLHPFFHWCEEIKKRTCLERDEVLDYLDSKDKSVGNPKRQGSVYAWHIDNLEIFDEPKGLKELKFQNGQPVGYTPQSWIYLD